MYSLPADSVSALKRILSHCSRGEEPGFYSDRPEIVITSHHKPDGDALGSSLALFRFLKGQGYSVRVVSPSESPSFLNWMSAFDSVVDAIANTKAAEEMIANARLIFCLDFNDLRRTEILKDFILRSPAQRVLIDHHLDPKLSEFSLSFSEPLASSTCELLYTILNEWGQDSVMDREWAECLYTGIMTDTGSFRFNSVSPHTHRVCARLLELGCRNDYVYNQVMDSYSETRQRFLGHALANLLEVDHSAGVAWFAIPESDLKKYNHQSGDLEGIVNYGLSISGIRMSALFSERDGGIRISFRSKNFLSVKEFSERYFEGGGHRNAAGGRSSQSLADTVRRFRLLYPEWIASAG